jgi:hypothetical protein
MSLPFVRIKDRLKLPGEPGIYFAMFESQILYVGKSNKSLRKRWARHHKEMDLLSVGSVNIAYAVGMDSQEINSLESALISIYAPPLNNAPVYSNGVRIRKPRIWEQFEHVPAPDLSQLSNEPSIKLSFEELIDVCDGDESMALCLENDLWSEVEVAQFRYTAEVKAQCQRWSAIMANYTSQELAE